jgi:hypothetical protein
MKKRVRVYRPGGQTNQPTHKDIVNYVSQEMSADDFDGDTDAIKDDLVNAGIPEDVADEYISNVSDDLGLNETEESIEEKERLAAEQARAQEEELQRQAYLAQKKAEEEAYDAQLEEMYNITGEEPIDEETYMQYGGSKPSKRSFINKYTKYAKMAMGGGTPSPGPDDVLDGREKKNQEFLNALTNSATDAILRQEAEAAYNYAYGGTKIGEFEDGGIQQEQIDFENPIHHIGAYALGVGDIFKNNQNIQNDSPQEQFGGNTGQGLYRFIGGGDNESADEMYQDADLDYNQYQEGGFRMPRRTARQYTQAVGSPYYTATGQAANPVDLANRKVTSVKVTKRGIFGRPKAFTVNYDGTQSVTPPTSPASNTVTRAPGEYTGPDEFTGRRQPLANWMMRTGIPGVRGLGAKMIKSGPAPVVPNVIPETFGTESGKYNYKNSGITKGEKPTYETPETTGTQRRDSYGNLIGNVIPETFGSESGKYNYKTSAITNPDRTPMQDYQYKPTELISRPRTEMQMPPSRQEQYTIDDADYGRQKLQEFLISKRQQEQANQINKEYGGPVDYTEYVYGGDISVPELYRAVDGVQTFDPNANPLGTKKDYKGDTVDFTGKVIKKRDPNFSIGEGTMDLKVPGTIDNTYTNPLTGDKPGVIMNEDGAYTDNKIDEEVNPKTKQGTSEDYLVKKNWNKTRDNFIMGMMGVNAISNIADQVSARKQENQLNDDLFSVESNYGINDIAFSGYHDPNTGRIDPSQTGQKISSKYGGGIYATGGSFEDEDEGIVYMTEAQIKRFLEEGGELEYV